MLIVPLWRFLTLTHPAVDNVSLTFTFSFTLFVSGVRIEGLEVNLSFIPVLGVVFFGVSVTGVFITCLRAAGARSLAKNMPGKELLEKVLTLVALLLLLLF